MHYFLPVQRVASHAAGDYHSEGAWRRGSSQPHPAAAERNLPAESECNSAGVGYCVESTPRGGEHRFSNSDQGNRALIPGCASARRFTHRLAAAVGRGMQILLLAIIRAYQVFISPALPSACRFVPTCSEYAREAIMYQGVWRGLWLTLRRLARCHPWGGHGFDPAPERTTGAVSSLTK